MGDGMDLFEMEATAPTLTFGAAEEAPAVPAVVEEKREVAPLDDGLSEEEKAQVEEFAKQIDLTNTGAVMQYGAGSQKKIAEFSERALENVRTKDMGEVGDMLTGLMVELKTMSDDPEEKKGLKGLFKKGETKLEVMKSRYASVEKNVDGIARQLENHQITLLRDIAMLDKMYEVNLAYFKELSMYILAGKKRLEQAKNTELPALTAKADASKLPEDVQVAKDFADKINRFEKKIYDLELTRTVALQMAPQIRMIQSNDTVMSDKIQSTLVNTIPLWKNQMVIAIGLQHGLDAAKAQREVSDMTNALLKKNAESLKVATIETAKESERGIVDIETLKATNQTLISTLDEVRNIQEEGRKKRAEAEQELRKIEDEMRSKLLEMSK